MSLLIILCSLIASPTLANGTGRESSKTVAIGSSASLTDMEQRNAKDVMMMRRNPLKNHNSDNSAETPTMLDAGMKTMTKSRRDGPGVSWAQCVMGSCTCAATKNRPMVIRLQQLEEKYPGQQRSYENSFHRQHFTGQYRHTAAAKFKMGFSGAAIQADKHHASEANIAVTNLQQCGGGSGDMIDCYYEPKPCTFDTDNPYDAKEGEYCCDPSKKYCSYKCISDETFACPEEVFDTNVPGGMNPVVNATKACFTAQYCKGGNPMSEDDSALDAC